MKKSIMLALMGLMFMGGMTAYAQGEDTTQVATDEPKDTISIDQMDPVYYEDEATEESSNTMTYAIIGGVVVIGAGAFFFLRKKKK